MRIVHAVRSDGFAGVERHIATLATAQALDGHDVTVVGGDPAAMRAALGADVVRLLPARTTGQVSARLRSAARDADVVHVHMTAAELGAALWRALPQIPSGRRRAAVVTTRHFAAPRGTGTLGGPVAAVARWAVDAQISISRYTAEHVDGPSTVIHAGLDVQPGALPSAQREPVVLLAQRLEPEKRTDVALAVFAASGLTAQGWRLRVLGDGSQREALLGLADELGVADAVELLGRRDDVAAQMRTAAVFLAPCPVEGYGLSALEALAAGIPVVADASAGHLETVGAVPGAALYRSLDVADGARVLARLAAEPARRDLLAARQQQVQRTSFTLAAQARATEQVYREVVARRRGRGSRPAPAVRGCEHAATAHSGAAR